MSYYHTDYLGNYNKSSEYGQEAVDLSFLLQDEDYIRKAFDVYFYNYDDFESESSASKNIQRLKLWAKRGSNENLRRYIDLYESYANYQAFEFKTALRNSEKAYRSAREVSDVKLEVRSLIQIGKCYERLTDKKKALQYLLKAIDLAQTNGYEQLQLKGLFSLAHMFHLNKNYQRSLDYRAEIEELILASDDVDSILLIQNQFSALESRGFLEGGLEVEDEIEQLMLYCHKRGYQRIYKECWAFYRSYLINHNRLEPLYALYNEIFPNELEQVKLSDEELYIRLQAYFEEYKGNIAQASILWKRLEPLWNTEPSFYKKSSRYLRYSQFLVRTKQYDTAYAKASAAKAWGLRANYLPFQLTAEELLEQIQLNRGYVESAYEHAKTKFELELRIKEMTNEEGLVILEMYHDLDRQELLRQKEEERRKAEIDASEFRSNVFGLGLILFLLLTSILFRQYYLTRKEKNRSESLLLNILPGDTAQELKQNGITTARLHKDVTVLFCDIVKFTEVSKLLSPSELVAELDIYFTAFDNIVIENGLEKIKTIGDAYMAVGGVLHGKASTAQDVVNTAFQVLSKVAILREERYSKGKPSFEFRVGIHTGDVIAGVVGSRKFQYDMWGETVNLAARMEQNSLPGKVTISQATYDLIKDDYECESRGKVEAKNIGAISMYFVNRRRV